MVSSIMMDRMHILLVRFKSKWLESWEAGRPGSSKTYELSGFIASWPPSLLALDASLEYRKYGQNANLLNRSMGIDVQPYNSGLYIFLIL
jgi:hypothetical protein